MSNEARWTMSRRALLGAASMLPLAALVPDLLSEAKAAGPHAPYRFFNEHESAVVDAATRRIAPGPEDDPLEAGHPGAAEAGVVRYIDTMLAVFSYSPPRIFTGGPISNRQVHGGHNYMADFTQLDHAQLFGWKKRIADLQQQYRVGVVALDKAAGGDFTSISAAQQDRVLASSAIAAFTALMFEHTIEGMYSNPEYGGNQNIVGWKEIGYPGDSQPIGYNAQQLASIDYDLLDPTGIVSAVLDNFETVARAMASRGKHA